MKQRGTMDQQEQDQMKLSFRAHEVLFSYPGL